MKLFNWMHRKLQRGNDYAKVASTTQVLYDADNLEKTDQKALLVELDNLVVDSTVLLTIGTLGRHSQFPDDLPGAEDEQEQKPSTAPAVGAVGEEKKVLEKPRPETVVVSEEHSTVFEPLLLESKEVGDGGDDVKEAGETTIRTTLLDLFLEADRVEKTRTFVNSYADGFASGGGRKESKTVKTDARSSGKERRTAAAAAAAYVMKKLAPVTKEEKNAISSSINKKLGQVATKVMRKKIHPEVNPHMLRKQATSGRRYNNHNTIDNGSDDCSFLLNCWYVP